MRNRIAKRTDDGFTLVELLVVIVIVGILTGLAYSVFVHQRVKAQNATAMADLRNAAIAEEAQETDSGNYVASISALDANGFRQSANTPLGIAVTTDGYCAVAGHSGSYYWYDSTAGGVQHTSTATLTPPSTATGSCRSVVPTTLS
jgi:prepilin-type N-terminal cleavage/methylation domain-containing protein